MVSQDLGIFENLLDKIAAIGLDNHQHALIEHAQLNLKDIKKNIRQLPVLEGKKQESAIVISAGPSVHRKKSIKRILDANYMGTTIAVDGAYITCLKQGLIPDFVFTLDPHRSRVVRWFGDHEFEEHAKNDDYFDRQDLDIEFRKNSIDQNKKNIDLVNQYGHLTKAIVSSSSPVNVVQRLNEACFDMYWWNPLVDDPQEPDSLTRKLYAINKLPCMNTGGNVGTAAWVFAQSILNIPRLAVVGMDLGYYHDLPKKQTQLYYEYLAHVGNEEQMNKEYFIDYEFPLTKEKYYTDPTYFWYRQNLLELAKGAAHKTFNCTEGGTLFGHNIECIDLDSFLKGCVKGD